MISLQRRNQSQKGSDREIFYDLTHLVVGQLIKLVFAANQKAFSNRT